MKEDFKQYYRQLCKENEGIPFFSKDWWLDHVCGPDAWGVSGLQERGSYLALLPYYQIKKLSFTILRQPCLTQIISPWFKEPNEGSRILPQLVETLSFADSLHLHIPMNRKEIDSLTFHGYELSERVTYLIDAKSAEDAHKRLDGNTRRLIQKAEKSLIVRDDLGFNVFYELLRKTFTRKNMDVPHNPSFLSRLDELCSGKNCKKILFSVDPHGNVHSAMYIVWDSNKVYYLMGGIDQAHKKSGGQSLLVWEAAKFALSQGKIFDFEGSMVPSIATFFRSFGSTPIKYAVVHKDHSFFLKCYRPFKNFISRNKNM